MTLKLKEAIVREAVLQYRDRLILDLCGGTGAWSEPYRLAGYNVKIIDPVQGSEDIRLYQHGGKDIYGILAAPPCNHLAVSGARYWEEKGPEALIEALSIADACLRLVALYKPTFWALENPVGRLRHYYGDPTLIFNPCDYGDPYTKKTLLWGNFNIPKKNPIEPIKVCKQGSWVQKLGGKSERTKRLRSITPPGFAQAFFEANR